MGGTGPDLFLDQYVWVRGAVGGDAEEDQTGGGGVCVDYNIFTFHGNTLGRGY
jgi:hypothetical protein